MLYRLYDKRQDLTHEEESFIKQGAQPVESENEAKVWNDKRWGIYRTINIFRNKKRIQENLEQIRSWFVDIDGEKDKAYLKIAKSPLLPSKLVETKNGFHLYFFSKDAVKENYEKIENILISFFGGDKNAKDLSRIAREPGFLHWKDHNNPFRINTLKEYDIQYTEKDIFENFPRIDTYTYINTYIHNIQNTIHSTSNNTIHNNNTNTNNNTVCNKYNTKISLGTYTCIHYKKQKNLREMADYIKTLNQGELLLKLSGAPELNYENFSLHPFKKGLQIYVNNKSTSCWIDQEGLIGSHDNGGPTVLNWICWYLKKQGVDTYTNQGREVLFNIVKKYLF